MTGTGCPLSVETETQPRLTCNEMITNMERVQATKALKDLSQDLPSDLTSAHAYSDLKVTRDNEDSAYINTPASSTLMKFNF